MLNNTNSCRKLKKEMCHLQLKMKKKPVSWNSFSRQRKYVKPQASLKQEPMLGTDHAATKPHCDNLNFVPYILNDRQSMLNKAN